MKLAPGYYKVRIKGMGMYGTTCHLLRVWIGNDLFDQKQKFYQLDHGQPEVVRSDDETEKLHSMEIVKMYSGRSRFDYKKASIKVSFMDSDGDEFEMNARTIDSFERIMSEFPGLMKVLGMNRQ